MKTCPKCNELNGENRTECWKCKASLGPVHTYKKICPKCETIFEANKEYCDKCGNRLSVYDNSSYKNNSYKSSSNDGCWMYVVSILIPIIGIILGCVYIAKDENELGKSLIITGVVSNVIYIFLSIMLAGCTL